VVSINVLIYKITTSSKQCRINHGPNGPLARGPQAAGGPQLMAPIFYSLFSKNLHTYLSTEE